MSILAVFAFSPHFLLNPFSPHHANKMTLLKVTNVLTIVKSNDYFSVLMSLALYAAFHTVFHWASRITLTSSPPTMMAAPPQSPLLPPPLPNFVHSPRAQYPDLFSFLPSLTPFMISFSLMAWNNSYKLRTPKFIFPTKIYSWNSDSCIWLPTWHLHLDCPIGNSNLTCPNASSWFPFPNSLPMSVLTLSVNA